MGCCKKQKVVPCYNSHTEVISSVLTLFKTKLARFHRKNSIFAQEIKNINLEFRNIDKETDVLSFPMDFEFSEEGMPYILGDIIISTEKSIEH